MDALSALVRAETVPAWRPPPFCRISWTSDAARGHWEPRLHAARDALEDLAVLRCADDGLARIAFVRGEALPRLEALAARANVSISTIERKPGRHDVAAGRTGRIALRIGAGPMQLSSDEGEADPIWRLASATAAATVFDEGCGLVVGGDWASNMLLAAIGLSALPDWPGSFDCGTAKAEGERLVAIAAAHGRNVQIDCLREALSWPMSWTALHGAAEVKTPVFRYIRDTVPTGNRLSVHRTGDALPREAARGLAFPFTGKPAA